ncbi:plasmid stability protein StbB [Bifidobacterium lemurum]|uniref:Ribonuclease VapC n=1 Tax=Bifidobacterium lemurum TaxID=1603886 RepID=A0A261FTD6_9BIFI|nr:type II toxin-antitoxin system VapC family toxin [Bifidobacterium lemurum]OZG62235.1 plasmid stability protein StbB [Bifidobacterium lemurum]QOL33604.1 type II toxin-antitoxin system VapC family toxin [Bifidobacterium lemurum]
MNNKSRPILVDTNVISEFYKPTPNPTVIAWLKQNDGAYISSITIMEMMYGLWRMPQGARRSVMAETIKRTMRNYENRILTFDRDAGIRCSLIRADLDAHGHPVGLADAQIAAIAQANDCTLATRNTKDFQHTGVPLVNPWETAA